MAHPLADTGEFSIPINPAVDAPPVSFSAHVQVDMAGQTHPGNVRTNNEDHFLCARFGRFLECLQTNLPPGEVPPRADEIGYGMVVADGIGGSVAGEEASKLAIRSLINLVLHFPDWILRLDDKLFTHEVMSRAAERCRDIQAAMQHRAQHDPRLAGFGTTLTVAKSLGKDLFLTHLGDSRAYWRRQRVLTQLTRDHTVAQELADQGFIDPGAVTSHRTRHMLTKAMSGRGDIVEPDVEKFELADGDCLLLCTDGLTEMLTDDQIAGVLGRDLPAADTCQELIAQALAAGGRDNVTVTVARYRFPAAG